MGSRFLTYGGGAGNLTDGTADVYAASLGAGNLAPSLPVRTTASRQLTTGTLDTSDITGLDADLSKIENISGATQVPDTTTFTGVVKAADPVDDEDLTTKLWVQTNASGAPPGTDAQTLRYNGVVAEASSLLQNDGAKVAIGTAAADPNAILEINSVDKAVLLPRVATGSLPAPQAGYIAYDTTADELTFATNVSAAPTVTEQLINTDITTTSSTPIAQEITSPPQTGDVTNLEVYLSGGGGSTVNVGLSNNLTTFNGYGAPPVIAPTTPGWYTIPLVAPFTITAGVPVYILIAANSGVNVAVYSSSISFPTNPLPGEKYFHSGGTEYEGADLAYKMTVQPASVPTWGQLASDAELLAHTSNATIHFTEASIDHLNIQNRGTVSHAGLDAHVAGALTSQLHWTTAGAYTAATDTGDITLTAGATSGDINLSTPGIGAVVVDSQIQGVLDGAAADDACTFGQFDAHASDALIHLDLLDTTKLEAINVSANLEQPNYIGKRVDNDFVSVAQCQASGAVFAGTAGSNTLYRYAMGMIGASYDPQQISLTPSTYSPASGTGRALVPHPSGSHVYWCLDGVGLLVFDATTEPVGAPVYTFPGVNTPRHVSFNWDVSQACVVRSNLNRLMIYDVTSATGFNYTGKYITGTPTRNASVWGVGAAVRHILYVARNNGTVSVLDTSLMVVGANTVADIQVQAPLTTGSQALNVSISTDGLRLYVASNATGIFSYDINQTTGALSARTPPSYDPGSVVDAIESCGGAGDPILITDGSGNLLTLAPADLSVINLEPLDLGSATDIARTADCSTVYVVGTGTATTQGLRIINTMTTISAPHLEATSKLTVDGAVADIAGYNTHVAGGNATGHFDATGSYTAPAANDLALAAPTGQAVTITAPATQDINLDAVSGNIVLNAAEATKITNLADGINPKDAVNKAQLDAAAAGFNPDLLRNKEQCLVSPLPADVLGWVSDTTQGVGHTLTAPAVGASTFDGYTIAVPTLRVLVQGTDGWDLVQDWIDGGFGANNLDGEWFRIDDRQTVKLYYFQVDVSGSPPTAPPAFDVSFPIPLTSPYTNADVAGAIMASTLASDPNLTVARVANSISIEIRTLSDQQGYSFANSPGAITAWLGGGGVSSYIHYRDNGIYTVTAVGDGITKTELTRAADADGNPVGEVATSDMTWIQLGTVHTGLAFIISAFTEGYGPITPDVDSQKWVVFHSTESGTLAGLNDVSVPTALAGDRLTYNGVDWVNVGNQMSDLTDMTIKATYAVGDRLTYSTVGELPFSQLTGGSDYSLAIGDSTAAQEIVINEAVYVGNILLQLSSWDVGTVDISWGLSSANNDFIGYPATVRNNSAMSPTLQQVGFSVDAVLPAGSYFLVVKVNAVAGDSIGAYVRAGAGADLYPDGAFYVAGNENTNYTMWFDVDTTPTFAWRNLPFRMGAKFADITPSGTQPASSVGGWNIRNLNTEVYNDVPGMSLEAGSRIVVPPGNYDISIVATDGPLPTGSRLALYDVNAGAHVASLRSCNSYQASSTPGTISMSISGVLQVSGGSRVYELQHYASGGTSVGFGYRLNVGGLDEIYATVVLRPL